MGIFDTNKIVPLERTISMNLNLAAAGLVGSEIATNGFKEALVVVTVTGSGVSFSPRGGKSGNGVYYPLLKCRNLYDLSKELDSITASGIYVIDLLASERLIFSNDNAVSGASANIVCVLREKSYSYNFADVNKNLTTLAATITSSLDNQKVVLLGSKLAKCTSKNQASAMNFTDVSKFRFFSVRIRTMASPSSVGYNTHSFIVTQDWRGYGKADGVSVDVPGSALGTPVITANNSYSEISSWQEIYAPSLALYIKCTDDVAPTEDNPVYFHVDLIGIR